MSAVEDPQWFARIVQRCTRDGHTSWEAVSRQSGLTRDMAKSMANVIAVRAAEVQQAPILLPVVEPLPEIDPPAKRDARRTACAHLRTRIMGILLKRPASAEDVANRINETTLASVRVRISQMQREGLLKHDGLYPRTWALSEKGVCQLRETRAKGAVTA